MVSHSRITFPGPMTYNDACPLDAFEAPLSPSGTAYPILETVHDITLMVSGGTVKSTVVDIDAHRRVSAFMRHGSMSLISLVCALLCPSFSVVWVVVSCLLFPLFVSYASVRFLRLTIRHLTTKKRRTHP